MENPTVPTARPAARFCTECGRPAQGKFCGGCGSPLPDLTGPDVSAETSSPPVVVPTQPRSRQAVQHSPADVDVDIDDELVRMSDDEEDDLAEVGGTSRRRLALPAWRSRSGAAVIAAALTATAALGAGGYALAGYLGDGPTRDALDISRSHMVSSVSAFTDADDAAQVAAAADAADSSAQRIEAAQRSLGQPDDATERAVVAQLGSEAALLAALAELADLPGSPLAVWGGAHADIAKTVKAESDSREALTALDSDATAGLPDTARMMSALTSTVGTTLAADAVREGDSLLTALGSAANTTELRAVAAKAAEQQPAVAAVLSSLSEDSGRAALTGYDRALKALAGLAKLDGENTGAWAGARAELTAAFGALAGASGDAGAGLTTASTNALAAADKMVSGAAAAIADWQAATAAAVKNRDADSAALTSYADAFRSEIKGYELLRKDLQAFFDRAQDPNVDVSYFEAYDVLYEAELDRKAVRDSLASLSVPTDVRAEHDEVVVAISRSVAAVRAAYDGISQAQECEEFCFYRDTPGFATFQSESDGIGKAYAAATAGWESAVAAAAATTAQRALPPKPEV